MILLGLAAVCLAALAGLFVRALLNIQRSRMEITWQEYGFGMAVISIVIVPLVMAFGAKIARNNNLTFYEYWNGWESQAIAEEIKCTRDGPCWYEYDCDPYTVQVSYQDCTGTGADRKCTTKYRTETRYHSCPYVDTETNYIVSTTLGDYTIAEHRFPENPDARRWRSGKQVPDYVIGKVGVGAPDFWLRAKERIESKKPGPVTKREAYVNYILASDRTILRQHSEEVQEYKSAKLLPDFQSGVYDFYYANKVYLVGYKTAYEAEWQKQLAYLNAAFGTDLQGDLHLVLVQNERISKNPDAYALTLKAYWQNQKKFGKNGLSKNATVVVIGTEDGASIKWARAFSGMPLGNEKLLVVIRDEMRGALIPDEVMKKLKTHLWGESDKNTRFARVSMTGKKGSNGGGFDYLGKEVPLTSNQNIAILAAAFFVSMFVWLVAAAYGDRWSW